MKKRYQSLCPCGFSESLGSIAEAVAAIQMHFDQAHKDLLPFGLTEPEALELLRVKNEEELFRKLGREKKRGSRNVRIQVSV